MFFLLPWAIFCVIVTFKQKKTKRGVPCSLMKIHNCIFNKFKTSWVSAVMLLEYFPFHFWHSAIEICFDSICFTIRISKLCKIENTIYNNMFVIPSDLCHLIDWVSIISFLHPLVCPTCYTSQGKPLLNPICHFCWHIWCCFTILWTQKIRIFGKFEER